MLLYVVMFPFDWEKFDFSITPVVVAAAPVVILVVVVVGGGGGGGGSVFQLLMMFMNQNRSLYNPFLYACIITCPFITRISRLFVANLFLAACIKSRRMFNSIVPLFCQESYACT